MALANDTNDNPTFARSAALRRQPGKFRNFVKFNISAMCSLFISLELDQLVYGVGRPPCQVPRPGLIEAAVLGMVD